MTGSLIFIILRVFTIIKPFYIKFARLRFKFYWAKFLNNPVVVKVSLYLKFLCWVSLRQVSLLIKVSPLLKFYRADFRLPTFAVPSFTVSSFAVSNFAVSSFICHAVSRAKFCQGRKSITYLENTWTILLIFFFYFFFSKWKPKILGLVLSMIVQIPMLDSV